MTGIGDHSRRNRKHNPAGCKRCKYRSVGNGWCNYGDITGRSRLVDGGPLLPNGGCKLHTNGDAIRRVRPVPMPRGQTSWNDYEKAKKPPETYRRIEELYNAGWYDSRIAREVHVSQGTVAAWRNRNGLESNYVIAQQKARENGE